MAEIKENNSEEGKALRFNKGKIPWSYSLEFPRAMRLLCAICQHGEGKYGRGNYHKGQKASVTIDSMMGHLEDWWCGTDFDPDSKLPHLGHFLWNAMVLVEDMLAKRSPDDDDRTFLRNELNIGLEDFHARYFNGKKPEVDNSNATDSEIAKPSTNVYDKHAERKKELESLNAKGDESDWTNKPVIKIESVDDLLLMVDAQLKPKKKDEGEVEL